MPITVRGAAEVLWKPNYTLTLASPGGLRFPNNGQAHPLEATLLNTNTLAPVAGRRVRLRTVLPNRPGDGSLAYTDGSGVARFRVSDTNAETVDYDAFLNPQNFIHSNVVSVQWQSVCPCALSITGNAGTVELETQGETPWYSVWYVTWTQTVTCSGEAPVVTSYSTGECTYSTEVGQPDLGSLNVSFTAITPPFADPPVSFRIAEYQAAQDAKVLQLETGGC